MPYLTVFTPTYNRSELLKRTYNSLCNQTNKDFVWIIIDDGSTDNTGELASQWIIENKINLKYIYKENGGLYTGYNKAIELADTPLTVCIDSDDYMPADACKKIISFWKENGSDEYAGIMGLDFTPDGVRLGDPLPKQKSISIIDLLVGRCKIKDADRKLVLRTELYKKYSPLPDFGMEKDFNPHYLHIKIGIEKEYLVLNENLCYVDYQEGGMTKAIFKQYFRSPKSYAYTRKLYMTLPNAPVKFILKNVIHYVSSCILARDKNIFKNSPKKLLTFLMLPFGALLTLFIKLKVK